MWNVKLRLCLASYLSTFMIEIPNLTGFGIQNFTNLYQLKGPDYIIFQIVSAGCLKEACLIIPVLANFKLETQFL